MYQLCVSNRAEIVAELQSDLEQNISSPERKPRLENIEQFQHTKWGAKIIMLVQESYTKLIFSNESELKCFKTTIRGIKEERNDFAHVQQLTTDGVPEKKTISTLEHKKFCKYDNDRMVLKVLCLSRGKPWTDADDADDENINVFPLAP
jgi:hypothetical protein